MKPLAMAVVVLMLGILPAAAESASTQPIRGPELYAMALEMIEWIAQRTEYTSNGVPRIVFVDNFVAAIAEYELKREGVLMTTINSLAVITRLQKPFISETTGADIHQKI